MKKRKMKDILKASYEKRHSLLAELERDDLTLQELADRYKKTATWAFLYIKRARQERCDAQRKRAAMETTGGEDVNTSLNGVA